MRQGGKQAVLRRTLRVIYVTMARSLLIRCGRVSLSSVEDFLSEEIVSMLSRKGKAIQTLLTRDSATTACRPY